MRRSRHHNRAVQLDLFQPPPATLRWKTLPGEVRQQVLPMVVRLLKEHHVGHPAAAVLAFCVALAAYNQLTVVKAALRAVHGEETVDAHVSSYYLAGEIAGTWQGLAIAVEDPIWSHRFADATASQMARFLLRAAKLVDLSTFQKHPRGPKKPPPKKTSGKKRKHVSIARILAKRKPAAC